MRYLRLLILLITATFPLSTPAQAGEDNLIENGDFSGGPAGWMWEQWDQKPVPGRVVGGKDGTAFQLGGLDSAEPRYLAKEIGIDPGKDHVLRFSLKLVDVPEGAVRVRMMVPNVGFVRGDDLVKLGGTQDWEEYEIPILAQDFGGQNKSILFFYHDQPNAGVLSIAGVSLVADAAAASLPAAVPQARNAVTLTGDTSKPTLSTYIPGEKVELIFEATGPPEKLRSEKVVLEIVDAAGGLIEKKEEPLVQAGGKYSARVQAPSDKFGFYRVRVKLAGGPALRPLGSRPAGFLTYAVVPDPRQRIDHGDRKSRFGMQGGFGPWAQESLAYLGARWVLDSEFEWRTKEPERSGQFLFSEYRPPASKPESWKTYSLPTLYASPEWAVVRETLTYMTGSLTPEGEKAWASYCREAVKAYMAKNPDRSERIYQITWEPVTPWGFKGTDSDLTKIFQIAHKIIHETDDKAVVAGPTKGITEEDIHQTLPLFQKGFGRYVDTVSLHPYFSIEPEKDGMVAAIRQLREGIRKLSGRDLPMIGTEQGHSTEEDPDRDLTQARGLIRQNLITLGEGFDFNMAFYIVDYRLGEQKGYGYYYNLVDGVPWGPAKAGPRPLVPAFAAQSLLLDGHTTAGAIEWLGGTKWGYVFEREGVVTLALWDYGSEPSEVSLPTGVKEVEIFDWMGNELAGRTTRGNLPLSLGPEPVYIRGVAPTLWGSGAGKLLAVAESALPVFPGDSITLKGRVNPGGQNVAIDLEADPLLGVAAQKQDIPGSPDEAPFAFSLAIPASIKPAAYPVRLSLENPDGVIAVTGATLQVKSPVSVTLVDQTDERKETKALVVRLREEQGRDVQGEISLELRGVANSRQSRDFQIAPGQETAIVFPFAAVNLDSTKSYRAKTRVTLKNGYQFEEDAPVNFLVAARRAKDPLSEAGWESLPAVALTKRQLIRSPGEFQGGQDLSGSLQFQWDERALYVRAEVTDDTFRQNYQGADTWKEDALQLAFNLDPRKEESRTGNLLADDASRQRKCELAVALTAAGPEIFRHITFDAQRFPLGLLPAGEVTARIRRDEGEKTTTYVLAIPWKTLGGDQAPRAGESIGLAVAVNDSDSAAQKDPSALGLFGGIIPNKDSRKFGQLLLGR
jgi:hypothetical protein